MKRFLLIGSMGVNDVGISCKNDRHFLVVIRRYFYLRHQIRSRANRGGIKFKEGEKGYA